MARAVRCFGRRKFITGLIPTISLLSDKKTLATIRSGADFISVSCFLTNREIDKDLSACLLKALIAQDAAFGKKVAQLAKSIASQAPASIDTLDMDALSSADQTCALTIISAWYTGVVGTGADAAVVLFDSAFLYDVTRDAVVVPTYCVWGVNYWTQAPPPAPMTGFTAPPPDFPIRFLLAIRRRIKFMWNFQID
ncbi:MAG: sugar dehydrogenase complex small subunit [Acidocella sp.]